MLLAFLDCTLDTRRHQLSRGGQACAVEPLVFDLLLHLATHRDRTFTRDELLERLWPGKVVTDGALSTAIKSARKAVGDDGRDQACIATQPRRGYRFVAPLRLLDEPAARCGPDPAELKAPAPRACVAVMPLRDEFGWNVGPVRTYGLTHDVIACLARLRSAAVIAMAACWNCRPAAWVPWRRRAACRPTMSSPARCVRIRAAWRWMSSWPR